MDIAHRFLPVFLFETVARIHLAERIDEEVRRTRFARQHAAAALDVVDQPHIEPCAEPAFRMVLLQLPFDQLFEVFAHLVLVGDYVVVLVEIIGVVESRRSELHAQGQRQLIEREHILGIVVRYGAAESDVFQPHLLQREQCSQPFVEAAGMSAQLVVLAAQAFDRDADADVRELFGQCHDFVFEPSGRGDDDAVRMFVALLHDLRQILADEGFSAGQVDEFQARQRTKVRSFDFVVFFRGVEPDVAHLAFHRTTIGQDNAGVGGVRDIFSRHDFDRFV